MRSVFAVHISFRSYQHFLFNVVLKYKLLCLTLMVFLAQKLKLLYIITVLFIFLLPLWYGKTGAS